MFNKIVAMMVTSLVNWIPYAVMQCTVSEVEMQWNHLYNGIHYLWLIQ